MSDLYEIWLYPLHDWWKTVGKMLDFMYTGQMEISFFALCFQFQNVAEGSLRMPEVNHTYRFAFLSLDSLLSRCSSVSGSTSVSDLTFRSCITWEPLRRENKRPQIAIVWNALA